MRGGGKEGGKEGRKEGEDSCFFLSEKERRVC